MPSKTTSRRRSRRTIKLSDPRAIMFFIILAALLIYEAWQENQSGGSPIFTNAPVVETSQPGAPGAITVYFSDPLSGRTDNGPEEHLVAAINGAQKTVDMAIYNISLENVANALIAAQERGVIVRMVMESEAMEGRQALRLLDAGIPIEGDQRSGLMHNKFTVIDGSEVWAGSMNYTSTSAYNDFNNLLRLRSQRAAQDYTVEFEEMFIEGLFGANDKPATPYPQITIDGVPVEIYFSPDDGVAEQIIDEIRQARQSIDFMAYSFTSDEIAGAIIQRAAAGVKVRGVFDESQVKSNQGGEYEAFSKDGFDVRLDGISGLLHHKVIIIDQKVVITGSYNFSASAEKTNDENIVIFHSPALAAQYEEQFKTVFQTGD